jgi:hypothetical protein
MVIADLELADSHLQAVEGTDSPQVAAGQAAEEGTGLHQS